MRHGLTNDSPAIRLGVVLPLANEKRTVEELLDRLLGQLTDRDRVYCVLDHASVDDTRERVRQAARRDSRVTLIWAPENECVVHAYFRGYREALAAGCRWILEMDGGLSHRPEEIPRFLTAMSAGADFTAGSRFIAGADYDGRPSRRLLSQGGTCLARWLLGAPMRDMTSGFECFTHEALSHVVATGVRSRAHFFQTEIRWMLRNWRWVEVPISYRAPSRGVSLGIILEALRQLWRLHCERRVLGRDDRSPPSEPAVTASALPARPSTASESEPDGCGNAVERAEAGHGG